MVVVLWCVLLAAAATGPSTGPATRPGEIPGVENFARVADGVYRGAQPTAEGFAELKKRGVKTVINLRAFHSDREELAGLGLRYVHVPSFAWHPEDEEIVRVLKVIADPENRPVFIHCQHGADRTGCAVAAWRIVEQSWSVEEAVKEMEAFGFHPIWEEIREYLEEFDTEATRRKVKDAKAPRVEVVE